MNKIARYIISCLVISVIVLPVLRAAQDTYRVAYDSGYSDGHSSGKQDRGSRRPFDFANKSNYQEASEGYDPALHDREVFSVAYRRGFEDGYEVGYGLGRDMRNLPATQPPPVTSTEETSRGGRSTLPAGTLIDIRLLETLSTQRNEGGDDFRAEVVMRVVQDGELVVPVGSRVFGSITHLKRPGRIKGRAEMNLRFDEIELPDGTRVPIDATVASIEERADEEVKDEEGTLQGKGEKGSDMKKVGTSSGIGALIGILTGGGSGAKAGAAVGAIAGLAGVLATRGSDVVLPSETELVIKLDREVTFQTGVLRPGP